MWKKKKRKRRKGSFCKLLKGKDGNSSPSHCPSYTRSTKWEVQVTAGCILRYIRNCIPGHIGFSFKELYLRDRLLCIAASESRLWALCHFNQSWPSAVLPGFYRWVYRAPDGLSDRPVRVKWLTARDGIGLELCFAALMPLLKIKKLVLILVDAHLHGERWGGG